MAGKNIVPQFEHTDDNVKFKALTSNELVIVGDCMVKWGYL